MNSSHWINAEWYLPRLEHLPVLVEFADGTSEVRKTIEGDWRAVKRWQRTGGKAK